MFKHLWQWINERWPAKPVIQTLLTEEIAGGATFKFGFGACVLSVFILQAVTGLMQLFFYTPSADHAYVSLSFLRTEVPFGWLIHNLHFWGATTMLVLVLIHMTQVYLWGAYKTPRELIWLLGSVNFLLAMLMMFAGSPLPWDERGYWSTEVGTSIAGTVPLVGDLVKRILRGGEAMGQPTISRFFVLHVAILPVLLITFITFHLVAFRRFGCVGPWQEKKRAISGPFWPDQLFKDTIMIAGIVVILLTLAVFVPPDFAGPADPLDPTFVPKSQWNFLFLFQALKYFPGRFEVVGTVGIPLVIILLLVLVPFVDRRKERNPAKRPLALGFYLLAALVVISLSVMGSRSQPGVSRSGAPTKPEGTAGSSDLQPSIEGEQLVKTLGCLGCHTIHGEGGKVGPDLSAEGSKGRAQEWLVEQIRNPKSHNPASVMPPFGSLEDGQVNVLVGYLLSLKSGITSPDRTYEPLSNPAAGTMDRGGQAKGDEDAASQTVSLARQYIGNPKHGAKLFLQYCESCHGPEGKGGVPNPGSDDKTVPPLNPIDEELVDKNPGRFVAKIDPFIQNGQTPSGSQPALRMPDFGRSLTLTQGQISHLEAYILSLNGVRREAISRPGLRPVSFYGLALAVFGLGLLLLAAIWLGKYRSQLGG